VTYLESNIHRNKFNNNRHSTLSSLTSSSSNLNNILNNSEDNSNTNSNNNTKDNKDNKNSATFRKTKHFGSVAQKNHLIKTCKSFLTASKNSKGKVFY
jgi:hypothetical protein